MIGWFLTGILFLQTPGEFQEGLSKLARRIRRKVAPSVVAILVDRTKDPEGVGRRGRRREHEDYFNRPKGYCTGTIVDPGGLVATSAFNVSGEIRSIHVLVHGRKEPVPAVLLAYDKRRDIALLRLEGVENLPVLELADLSNVAVGSLAFVIGRAPDPAEPTINFGMISALHRFGGDHLQTDAELNYGNVGGPLVDTRGRLIGITTHISPRARWGQSGGIGFALKADRFFREVLPSLLAGRKVERSGKEKLPPTLGIVAAPGARNLQGVLVSDVLPDSAAEKAGVRPGDIILEVDGTRVRRPEDIDRVLKGKKVGDRVKIRLKRRTPQGEEVERTVEAALGEIPEY